MDRNLKSSADNSQPQRNSGNRQSVKRTAFRGKSAFNDKLTAKEAKHILMAEGGVMTGREALIQLLWAGGVSAALAWAIVHGQATIWHLVVPLVCEYLVLVAALPLVYLVMRHPALKDEFIKCSRALVMWGVGLVATVIWRAKNAELPVMEQLTKDFTWLQNWLLDHQVHWAMLIAVFHAARSLTRSINHLLKFGPPFIGGGLGCAMKIIVVFFAAVLVPAGGFFLAGVLKDFGITSFPPKSWGPPQNWIAPVWLVWGLLLIADLLTIWFLWDVQSKLKKEGHLDQELAERDAASGKI
jgi:hypothetical protein